MSSSLSDHVFVGTLTRPIHALGSSSAPARIASFRFISIRWRIDARDGYASSAKSM
jgi:hypothetical protein